MKKLLTAVLLSTVIAAPGFATGSASGSDDNGLPKAKGTNILLLKKIEYDVCHARKVYNANLVCQANQVIARDIRKCVAAYPEDTLNKALSQCTRIQRGILGKQELTDVEISTDEEDNIVVTLSTDVDNCGGSHLKIVNKGSNFHEFDNLCEQPREYSYCKWGFCFGLKPKKYKRCITDGKGTKFSGNVITSTVYGSAMPIISQAPACLESGVITLKDDSLQD